VGDLKGFVHGVIGRKDTVDYGFCAFDGEVAVNFDHGVARGDEVRAVDLDFGVVLARAEESEQKIIKTTAAAQSG